MAFWVQACLVEVWSWSVPGSILLQEYQSRAALLLRSDRNSALRLPLRGYCNLKILLRKGAYHQSVAVGFYGPEVNQPDLPLGRP